MQIKKGQNRIVFVFPKLGISIKIPIIHFLEVLRHESLWLPQKRDWELLNQFKEITQDRISDDSHHFSNSDNFCFDKKRKNFWQKKKQAKRPSLGNLIISPDGLF